MRAGRTAAGKRVIAVVVVILVSLGGALLYLRTHDAQTAGQAGTQKSGKPDGALRWGEIQTLSKRGKVGVPAVAFDPVVGTVAAWPRNNHLELRIRPPDGTWGRTEVIADGVAASNTMSALVDTDRHGTVTVAWIRELPKEQTPTQLLVATRSAAGVWEAPTILWEGTWPPVIDEYDPSLAPLSEPRLAVGPDGSAAVAWFTNSFRGILEEGGPPPSARAATQSRVAYRPAGGDWQRSVQVGDFIVGLDIDDDGVVTAAAGYGRGTRAVRYQGGRWQVGEVIARGGYGVWDAAMAPDGTAAVVLQKTVRGREEVFASHREGDAWTAPVQISTGKPRSPYYNNPQVTLHGGSTTIVLTSWNGPVQAVTRPPTGDYGPPSQITAHVTPSESVLGVWANDSGQALAVWGPDAAEASGWVLKASYRSTGNGAWAAPVPLSGGGSTQADPYTAYNGVAAVVYPDGSAAALWANGNLIRIRSLDRAP